MILKIDGKLRNLFNVNILAHLRKNVTVYFETGSKQNKYFNYNEFASHWVKFLTDRKMAILSKKNGKLIANASKLLAKIDKRTIRQKLKVEKICKKNIQLNCEATDKMIMKLAHKKLNQLTKIACDNNN